MKPIDNLGASLKRGFVSWACYLTGAAEIIMEFGFGEGLPRWLLIAIVLVIFIGRHVKQEAVSGEVSNV